MTDPVDKIKNKIRKLKFYEKVHLMDWLNEWFDYYTHLSEDE